MNELLDYDFEHSVIKGGLCFHISEKEDRYINLFHCSYVLFLYDGLYKGKYPLQEGK